MQYFLSKDFEKQFRKLPKKIRDKVIEQLQVFSVDQIDKQLNNHALHGVWANYRSIDVTGDIRAIYKLVDNKIAMFVTIGSHSKLYG